MFNTNIMEANFSLKRLRVCVCKGFLSLCLLTFLMRQEAHRKLQTKHNFFFSSCCCFGGVLIHEVVPYKFSVGHTNNMPKKRRNGTQKDGERTKSGTEEDNDDNDKRKLTNSNHRSRLDELFSIQSINAIKTHWLAYLNDNKTVKRKNKKNLSST